MLHMTQQIKNVIQRFYIKRTNDFFEKSVLSLNFATQDIELQCEGYSLFNPDEVLSNFIDFLIDLAKEVNKNSSLTITNLKIHLNGFIVKDKTIKTIADCIVLMNRNIKSLTVHTSDLSNVTNDDFALLLRLMLGIGQTNNLNFQDFSLQCANWTFKQKQPTLQDIMFIFKKKLFQNNIDEKGEREHLGKVLHQKRIRLEMSGWWYKLDDARKFLGFPVRDKKAQQQFMKSLEAKKIQQDQINQKVSIFHLSIQQMIQNLLSMTNSIQVLEIDLRNNNEFLQMKKLKTAAISKVSKGGQSERSIISMRQTQKLERQREEGQKGLRIDFTV